MTSISAPSKASKPRLSLVQPEERERVMLDEYGCPMSAARRRGEEARLEESKRKKKPVTITGPATRTLQENLITLLAYSNSEGGKLVTESVSADLFEGDYRTIAERCIAFRKKHNQAPKLHTPDLVADILEDKDNKKAPTFKRILKSMHDLSDYLNEDFVKDSVAQFVRQQTMKDGILRAAETLQAGDLAGAEEIVAELADYQPSTDDVLTAVPLNQFELKDLKWLWFPFFPQGMVATVFGDGEVGKSCVTIDMAAKITRGARWPKIGDDVPERAPKGSVIIISCEDDPSLIIAPRLAAAGADLSRVHIIGYGDAHEFDPVTRLDNTARKIERIIEDIGDVRLVVIDPITEFTGKTDNYNDASIRNLMKPLVRMAAKHSLTIVNILHMNKKTDQAVRYRMLGGGAFRNVSRACLLVAHDPEQPGRRLLIMEKGNLCAEKRSVGFNLKTVNAQPTVQWDGEWQQITADEAIAERRPTKKSKAAELLKKWLTDGPVPVNELKECALAADISWSTLDKARAEIGVIATKQTGKGGGWLWQLPQ